MGQIWITSDWHFGHNRDFIWGARGFNSVYEMDKAIIERHNEIVSYNDDVYCLGDLILGDNDYGISCIKKLKGNIHVIRGNHDSAQRMLLYNDCYNVIEISEGQFIKYNGYHFYLTHYPCLTDNYDDESLKRKMINICGHRHCKNWSYDLDKGTIFHAEMDTQNCYPWNIDDIILNLKEAQRFVTE